MESSTVSFPDDPYVAGLVATGRYHDPAAVWRAGLTLLAARERERDDREAAQLCLLHDVLAREAAHPAPAASVSEPAPVDIPLVVDAQAVLSEIELLLSARAPRQFRRAG